MRQTGTFFWWGGQTIQIRRNARGEESARGHGQRTPQVRHTGQRAAVEDVEAVLHINVSKLNSGGETVEMEGEVRCAPY